MDLKTAAKNAIALLAAISFFPNVGDQLNGWALISGG
jgi:hypothetical protein